MCGVVGILEFDRSMSPDMEILRTMCTMLEHRGPDDKGVYRSGEIGLGHRRLSIIDLDAGHQPLSNEDGTVWVVYNGEIYNFRDLREELSRRGHRFRTRCDTEVIVHAWEEWGEECLARFNGMFAIGLWDAGRSLLFLARDRLGIKPLYYGVVPSRRMLFASELKALMVDPGVPRTLDPCAVEEYFALGYIAAPRSIFSSVRKLPAGHFVTATAAGGVGAPQCYWDVNFLETEVRDEVEARLELFHRISEAVRLRLVADVPLGAFLSGGVDSSTVVAAMAPQMSAPVKTFSMAFPERAFDESPYAGLVAGRYRTDHTVEQVDPRSFDLVDKLIGFYDEPFADSSAIPTYGVSGLARSRVTVALSGDGGDELLAGYRHYRWMLGVDRLRRLVPPAVRGPLFGLAGRLYPRAAWAPRPLRAKYALGAAAMDLPEAYLHCVSILKDDVRSRLFSKALTSSLQGYSAAEMFRFHFDRASARDPLSRMQYVDLKTFLPEDILTKVDRASMAHSLEVRVPLLDHELVGWIAALEPCMRLHGSEGKYLLKGAMEPYLPAEVLYRRKMGFTAPTDLWFKHELRDRVRRLHREPRLADSGLFNAGWIKKMADEHITGLNKLSTPLWSLMMFDSFLDKTLDNATPRLGSIDAPSPQGVLR